MQAINIIILTFVIVFVQNHSGFVHNMTQTLYEWIKGKPYKGQPMRQLLSCSMCQVHWLSLFYCLFTGVSFIHSLGIASLAAIGSLLVDKIIGVIIRLINRIQ